MNQRTRLVLVAVLLVAGPAAAQNRDADTGQPAVPEEVRAWLSANAIPLDTTEPERGLADLEPLKAMIGGARLVALGEATHGTREFFQLAHDRLTEDGIFTLWVPLPCFESDFGMILRSLGEVNMQKGNVDRAIACYEKSLELNPDNENGAEMLKKLREMMADQHP